MTDRQLVTVDQAVDILLRDLTARGQVLPPGLSRARLRRLLRLLAERHGVTIHPDALAVTVTRQVTADALAVADLDTLAEHLADAIDDALQRGSRGSQGHA